MTIRIYVGDTNPELAQAAALDNPAAFLIDRSNYKQFLTTDYLHDVVAFTALGDLPKDLEVFYHILMKADEVVYSPPEQWSDDQMLTNVDPTTAIQGLTENLLLAISNHRPVKNIELCYFENQLSQLVDVRRSADPQLWIAGCSISHAIGVKNDQRYGHLLAQRLGLECSFLTRPGSSIQWASDQITRSDIRSGDIVIWGITEGARIPYFFNNQSLALTGKVYIDNPSLEKIVSVSELLSENTLYHNIAAVERVLNFCDKTGVKLGMVGVMHQIPNFYRYIKTKSQYVDFPYKHTWKNNILTNQFQDIGSDGSHPGPMQHKLYANFILNHFDFLQTTNNKNSLTLC